MYHLRLRQICLAVEKKKERFCTKIEEVALSEIERKESDPKGWPLNSSPHRAANAQNSENGLRRPAVDGVRGRNR